MARYSKNLATGRQLRAARVLAGLTQRSLGAALGVDERAVRFWERRHHSQPSRACYHGRIKQALLEHRVILSAEPFTGGEDSGQGWLMDGIGSPEPSTGLTLTESVASHRRHSATATAPPRVFWTSKEACFQVGGWRSA